MSISPVCMGMIYVYCCLLPPTDKHICGLSVSRALRIEAYYRDQAWREKCSGPHTVCLALCARRDVGMK